MKRPGYAGRMRWIFGVGRWCFSVFFLFLLLGLTACSLVEPLFTTLFVGAKYGDNGRAYKEGNPYRIDRILYVPHADYRYDKVGLASWYGPHFNRGLTANGGVYNMYRVSAAHKTLPLPSIVLVTNLENGRSLKVKVNDRGPYVGNRIIDLSYEAATILGIKNKGLVRVRVQILAAESRALKAYVLSKGKKGYSLDSPYEEVPEALYRKYGKEERVKKVRTRQYKKKPHKPKPRRQVHSVESVWLPKGARVVQTKEGVSWVRTPEHKGVQPPMPPRENLPPIPSGTVGKQRLPENTMK